MKRVLSFICMFIIMVSLFSAFEVSTSAVETVMPDDVEYFGGNAYKIYIGSAKWDQAREYCESLGGHLVTISDWLEWEFVKYLEEIYSNKSGYLWIGGEKKGNSFDWVTNEEFDFCIWDENEPNESSDYNAIAFKRKSGLWKTANKTTDTFGFICEWEDVTPTFEHYKFGDNLYMMYHDVVDTWEEAKAFCEEMGGHLVTISSKEENDAVFSYLKSTGMRNAYIGLSDTETLGEYKWVTGESVDFINWNNGDPNHLNEKERYAQFFIHHDSRWVDNDFCTTHKESVGDSKTFICEWDDVASNTYDYNKDRYEFRNYCDIISEKYFTTIYETAAGKTLRKKITNPGGHGLCFGMATTEAAIYNGYPNCSSFVTFDSNSNEYKKCGKIRDITNAGYVDYMRKYVASNYMQGQIVNSSTFEVGGNTISIDDYIKYAHVYQWSSEAAWDMERTEGDIQGLVSAVKSRTALNQAGVTIRVEHNKGGAHLMFAVGYDGNDILIDDNNITRGEPERLTINNDGTWEHSYSWTGDGINNKNSKIHYFTSYYRPYQILSTGKHTTVGMNTRETNSNTETYVEGMDRLDADSTLAYINCDNISSLPANTVKIQSETGGETDNLETGSLYWLKSTDSFEVSSITGENNEITLANDDKILMVLVDNATDFAATVGNENTNVKFNGESGKECEISYTTVKDDGDVELRIKGEISEKEISIEQTIDGVAVKGISKGTATLTNGETKVEFDSFEDSDSEFSIAYDETGISNDLSVSADIINHSFSEYKYNNDATCCKNGTETAKCDNCDETDTREKIDTSLGHTDTTKVFEDVIEGRWYNKAIDYNYTHEFISGLSKTEFGIDNKVTRGMFITILARIAGIDTGKQANKITTKFTDVKSGKYYTAAIKWANDNGIVSGTSTTTFGPENNISRQDICVMILNFAKFMDIELTKKESEILFDDAESIAKYAKNAVKICQMADIVNGYSNTIGYEFKPIKTATRAEAAQILYVFHNNFIAEN